MDFSTFKALVDLNQGQVQGQGQIPQHTSDELLSLILACFTARQSDQARLMVRDFIVDVGLRHLCDQAPAEPYLGVAEALQAALRERGCSQQEDSDWERAIQLASLYALLYPSPVPVSQKLEMNTRVNVLATSVLGLRGRGYTVTLPDTGGVDADSEIARIAADIDKLSASLGSALADSAVGAMVRSYSEVAGRFAIGRPGQTVQLGAKPDVTLAYLYQLGLRYFDKEPSALNPQMALRQLQDLLTWASALHDLTLGTLELIHARPNDIIGIIQKSVMYDAVFLVTQVKPAHAREYLLWLMSQDELARLKDAQGRTAAQVLAVALMLLSQCERVAPDAFTPIDVLEAAYACGLDRDEAARLLQDIFMHAKGANQELSYPPKDTHVDAAFRPLLGAGGRLWMQPPPMAARAIVNAALKWCEGKNKNFDDKVLGPLFESFVREKLKEHGVNVIHGDYNEAGSQSSECDALVETNDAIMILELKTKMLTRRGRGADGVVTLADLSQAIVRPQAQAMERHAVLQERGSMTLRSKDGKSVTKVQLGPREVLRVSITRGDLGSLHDRAFLQHFLRAGCVSTFQATDPKRQADLDDFHKYFKKFDAAALRAGERDLSKVFPFERSWSLSVFQLLLLLERTTDSESFSRELQRNRRVFTPMRDFYTEYEFALQLSQYRANAAPAP
ncbi:hypothetical protein SAMN05216350_1174 [Polaromonas sp. YR568]|uniref:hypothetical protein n=1 Tax=Polaromonas sp. YR568 TaxID=1855301 RepID=UPI0008DF0848|nr:hypothetical protein [Polaromonas sp. YR568]SFV03574.1 hypothetical protein SAMN05216350_1174 [Polaromonas sp. YR568]